MGKSEGEVLPACPICGSDKVEEAHDEVDIGVGIQHGPSSYRCSECLNVWDYHNVPVERMGYRGGYAAEGLVPAAALDELVKAAMLAASVRTAKYMRVAQGVIDFNAGYTVRHPNPEEVDKYSKEIAESVSKDFPAIYEALAHAREIAKGGKDVEAKD